MVDLTVGRAFTLALRKSANRPAILSSRGVITHRELNELSDTLAGGLLALGLKHGDRVAVAMPNRAEYVIVAIACAKAGLVLVTLNYRFTAQEYRNQIRDSGAAAVIYVDSIPAVRTISADVPGLKSICLGVSQHDEITWESLMASGIGPLSDAPVAETDLLYLGYTSGTTGRPKGAMVTHRNRVLAYHYWAIEFGLTADDVMLHCAPFHHSAPFTFVLSQLYIGGQVVILDHFDANACLDAIERAGVTWAFWVPFMSERILDTLRQSDRRQNLSTFRMIISGAAPLPTRTKLALLDCFKGSALHEFYGATEAGVITNLRPDHQSSKIRCVGQPVFDMEIAIRSEAGHDLPPGEVGDIWLRGPTLFSGYFKDPEKTAAMFNRDWCTLGDIGWVDEENFLYIIDRRKDVIKSGGVNIYPIEIEEVLLEDPDIAEVAVVGVPDEVWGEAVHAVIVCRTGTAENVSRLASLCRDKLAGYKVPKSFEFRAALPRNANGKILKRVLREEYVARDHAMLPLSS
jgi:long-chain acyl-CoA synthetase